MERKPQQQTLSIRIPVAQRDNTGDQSRTSSMLCSTINIVTGSCCAVNRIVRIRRKWERRISLARAEWGFVANDIEGRGQADPDWAGVLSALQGCRHRGTRGQGLDRDVAIRTARGSDSPFTSFAPARNIS
jgi:hypothetical protein